MPFHPAHSLFVLLELTDLNNEEHLIRFVKENQKFQLKIQDGLLHAHMNRLRIKEGKEPKKVLEIGADDAVPFRIALILDYLSMLPIEQARAYYDKVLEISEKFDSVLAKAPQNRKGDVVRWGEEQGFLTGLEAAFEAAERYDFKKPDNDDLEEAFVTIHDVQINASKENLFERILALEPSNNLAIVDFFQRAEQDLFNTKQFVFGDAITGLDEQLPLLIAFSTDIALRENIDSEKMQVIVDKLMVVSNVFLETIRALPDGDMQDKLNEQYAWCFNLSSALSYITQNSTVDVLSDPQTFEYFSKLHHNKLSIAIQLNAVIRETQKKLDKERDPEKRLSYQKEITDKINQLKELVKQNPEIVRMQDTAGHNILYYVAKESPNPAIVEFLINNGCDVSQMGVVKTDIEADYLVDRKGNPVQFLGYDGETREITLNERLLQLKNPAAFDIYKTQKILPKIQMLIEGNDVNELRELFSTHECSGINPNFSINASGDTLMHLACRANHPEMIEFFLRHEFDKGREIKFNIQNAEGLRSFELIDDKESTQSFKQRMKYIYDAEQLLNCIKEKSFDEFTTELQRVMDNGFDLNGQYGFNGESLLHLCVASSQVIGEEKLDALFKHLQEKGADFNARDKKGETPLFKAAQTPSFSLEIFKKLIEQYHADPDILSKNNGSILASALNIGRSNREISAFLLDRYEQTGRLYVTKEGENIPYISLPDNDGLTAMHYAIDQNNTEVINRLLDQGFDLTLDLEDWVVYEGRKKSDRIGYSLLHHAAEKCSVETFEKIFNKYKDQLMVQVISQNLHLSPVERDQAFEELFVEKINELDGQIGFTLLHAALNNHNSKEIIDILKQNGARLTEENVATGQSHMARAMIPFSKAIVTAQPFDVTAKLISPEMLTMHFSNHARTPLMMVLDNLIGKTDVQVKDNKSAQAQSKKAKNVFSLGKPSNITVNAQLLAHLISMNADDGIYKQTDATGNTALHYAMKILSMPLTKEQLNPVLQVIERSLKADISLNAENTDGKSSLDLLAEVTTGHFMHDIMPKKLFDELEAKGINPEEPQFEEYNIRSFTEPFVVLSEHRETTLLAEILNNHTPDNYLSFLQLALMRDPNLRSNIADTLLNPGALGSTVLGNLFKNPASNPAAIAFALQCVDLRDKRFANVVCDEIPIDSPYLDMGDERFLKKWLNEGLDINHQGEKTGNTLLHKRFQQGDSTDVAALLGQGANPKLKNNEGHTARASKPEHDISVSVVMNYGLKYAVKTLNNGVKRLWNGLRGKKDEPPTPVVQEINHIDKEFVEPLKETESVFAQEMQQKKGVRFVNDSIELAEKKSLVEESKVLPSAPPKSEWQSVKPSHSNPQASLLMRKAITLMTNEHKRHKKVVVVNEEKVELMLSSAVVASQFCIQQFQQALKELESGKLPNFCESDVPPSIARQACIDIIKKMSTLEKAGKIEPTAIRMIAFDVGAGRVLRKENPLSELRTKLEGMENTSRAKFKPGGSPASGA